MELKLNIYSIFPTLNGEIGIIQGMPTLFIRLAGCHLRCDWCDTPYALEGKTGKLQYVDHIVNSIHGHKLNNIVITGGEPLLQQRGLAGLIKQLRDSRPKGQYTIAIETSGSIKVFEPMEVDYWVFDFKLKGSGMRDMMLDPVDIMNSIRNLQPLDKKLIVKFVIANKDDWDEMVVVRDRFINNVGKILGSYSDVIHFAVSPVYGEMDMKVLAEWIMADQYRNATSLNLQIHKYVWPEGEVEK